MNKIAILIDFQYDFIYGSLGTKEAQLTVPNVIAFLKWLHDNGYKLYATRDTHFDSGKNMYENTLEGKKLPVRHCIIDTEGWQIINPVNEILKDAKAIIVNKLTFGSFELAEILRKENEISPITEIVIIGLCTDICVVSNALILRALFKDIPIKIKENCCAGVTPETHKAAIETMKMCQIDVT